MELAKRRDLRKLREECARTQARAEDEAKRAERLHRQRSLRTWTAADGSWNLSAKNSPEVGALVEAVLAPLKEAVFQAARLAGEHESHEAYAADALGEMARRAAGAKDAGEQAGGGSAEGPGRDQDTAQAAAPAETTESANAGPEEDTPPVSYTHLTLPTTERV